MGGSGIFFTFVQMMEINYLPLFFFLPFRQVFRWQRHLKETEANLISITCTVLSKLIKIETTTAASITYAYPPGYAPAPTLTSKKKKKMGRGEMDGLGV